MLAMMYYEGRTAIKYSKRHSANGSTQSFRMPVNLVIRCLIFMRNTQEIRSMQ